MEVSVGLHVTVIVCPLPLPVIHRHCCTTHHPPADPAPDFQHAVARAVAMSPFPAARVSRTPAAEEEHGAACVGVVVGLVDDGPPAFGAECGGGVSAHACASGGCRVGLYMCVVGYIYGFLDLVLGVVSKALALSLSVGKRFGWRMRAGFAFPYAVLAQVYGPCTCRGSCSSLHIFCTSVVCLFSAWVAV